jgi:uncharacterized membrane protein
VSIAVTLAILSAALGLAALANWRERRPRDLGEPPLVPWITVQIVAVVIAILMSAHVVSLLTGSPLRSRFGF